MEEDQLGEKTGAHDSARFRMDEQAGIGDATTIPPRAGQAMETLEAADKGERRHFYDRFAGDLQCGQAVAATSFGREYPHSGEFRMFPEDPQEKGDDLGDSAQILSKCEECRVEIDRPAP
jgi:hypothetical protein